MTQVGGSTRRSPPDKLVPSAHVMGRDGRRAFSMGRHVYDEAGVAAVLGALGMTLIIAGDRGSIFGVGPEGALSGDETTLLLYGYQAFDAHPERACRLGLVGRPDDCDARTTAAFQPRARELGKGSSAALLSRSKASRSHEVTLLAIRRDGDAHVIDLFVVDDGERLCGVEVVFVDLDPDPDVVRPAIDDARCSGRPETSIHRAARYEPCG